MEGPRPADCHRAGQEGEGVWKERGPGGCRGQGGVEERGWACHARGNSWWVRPRSVTDGF